MDLHKIFKLIVWAGLLATSATSTHATHLQIQQSAETQQLALEPPTAISALQLLSFGYRELISDIYWLKSIWHFGDRKMHPLKYPLLGPYLERVVTLDPYFAYAYVFIAYSLTYANMENKELPIRLLAQGGRMRPDVWTIPYVWGYYAYEMLGDYTQAGYALSIAAKSGQAPEIVGELASKMATMDKNPLIGLELIDTLLANTNDTKLIEIYQQRREDILQKLQQQTP